MVGCLWWCIHPVKLNLMSVDLKSVFSCEIHVHGLCLCVIGSGWRGMVQTAGFQGCESGYW